MANNYNPDVLNCIANLSNDEVFTPPSLANQVLDLLPQDLFQSPDTTFLDPFTKSGVFLREIVKRLDRGLTSQIPDRQQRIDHILHKQVFGIACTELTSLLSRRSVYCSKHADGKYSVSPFETEEGNILYTPLLHTWKDGHCVFCGANKDAYDRGEGSEQYAYQFIHTHNPHIFFSNMKFDVIIGNPPYQLSDGGSAGGAMPLYDKFVTQALKLNPRYLSMIIPSRWFAGGRGLNEFRDKMLNDPHLRVIVDYPKSRDCFQGVDIAGGVCYFLWDSLYSGECKVTSIIGDSISSSMRRLNEFSIFVRSNVGINIIHKVQKRSTSYIDELVAPVSPFGLRSFVRGEKQPFSGSVVLNSSEGKSYIPIQDVKKGVELIDKYKVVVGYLNPDRAGVNNASDGKSNVTTKVSILSPGEVITETYIVLGGFNSYSEATNYTTYIKTRFVRLLVFLTLSSMHITKLNFQFVPMQDFSKPWDDVQLYEKYGLDNDEIAFIENTIRVME